MRHERQVELLEPLVHAGPGYVGLHGPASMINHASAYTDDARFERVTPSPNGAARSLWMSSPLSATTSDDECRNWFSTNFGLDL